MYTNQELKTSTIQSTALKSILLQLKIKFTLVNGGESSSSSMYCMRSNIKYLFQNYDKALQHSM